MLLEGERSHLTVVVFFFPVRSFELVESSLRSLDQQRGGTEAAAAHTRLAGWQAHLVASVRSQGSAKHSQSVSTSSSSSFGNIPELRFAFWFLLLDREISCG